MSELRLGLLLAISILFGSHQAAAQAGPIVRGEYQLNPECRTAWNMANSTFNSTNPRLIWPIIAPDSSESTVVLARSAADISGGDGIAADTTVFERIETASRGVRAIFWQKEPGNDQRTVLVDFRFSWQGDLYSLFSLPTNISEEAFTLELENETASRFAVLERVWHPPIVLRNQASKGLWAIDQGHPAVALNAWQIFLATADGFLSPCHVEFVHNEGAGLSQLPSAVQRFGELIDEALGPGTNEGTLRPTGRIRNNVARDWAIMSHRPWALTATPYNSREEVEDGLVRWAAVNSDRQRLFNKIVPELEAAIQPLATFYVDKFDISAEDARKYSEFALDHMFRRQFIFAISGTGDRAAVPTPWPDQVTSTLSIATEKRCGWLENPTPANHWLTDADGEWTVSIQGGHQSEGFYDLPASNLEFGDQWVPFAAGHSYGYGCACLDGHFDQDTRYAKQIVAAQPLALEQCRTDPNLPQEPNP